MEGMGWRGCSKTFSLQWPITLCNWAAAAALIDDPGCRRGRGMREACRGEVVEL